MLKRCFDIWVSGLGLVFLAPVFLVISIAVKLDSRGPVFFRQERIGLHGKPFRIHKFRTMAVGGACPKMEITVGNDVRITRVGRFLRAYKLDELAQLVDVFIGEMSFVGPRPEVAMYVLCYPAAIRDVVLSVKPGITDWASIEYRDEARILAQAEDPQIVYVERILPIKLKYYVDYVRERSFWGDLVIIIRTIAVVFR